MPPTVYWQDAGIYLSGLYVGGNVYPPGFPLYMVFGKIWTQIIPTELFTQKVHAFSAWAGAISSVLGYVITMEFINSKSTLFRKKKVLQGSNIEGESIAGKVDPVDSKPIGKQVAAIVSALLIGLNFNLWAQAINAEVYALHVLIFSWIVYLIILLGKEGRIEKEINSKQKRIVIVIAIIYGLSFANHPMTIVLAPVFIGIAFYQKNIFYHTRLLVIAALLFGISGVGFYAYLPLTANTHPIINWGNPNNVSRFIKHVTGEAYVTGEQSFVFTDLTRYKAALEEFTWEFGYTGLVLALIGFVLLTKSDRFLAALSAVIIIFHLIFAVLYKQTTEYNSWLLPAHMILAILIGYAVYGIFSELRTNLQGKTYTLPILGLVSTILFTSFIIPHWTANLNELNRSAYYYAEDFGRNILGNLDPNSLIIMTGDQESSTVMYLQTVKQFRTDVLAFKNIEVDELQTAEGRAELSRRYPGLIVPPENTDSEQVKDSSRYLNRLIDANISSRSVYLMTKSLFALDTKYGLIPAAAMYKVVPLNCTDCNTDIDLKYWKFTFHDPNYYQKKERPLMSLKDASAPGGTRRVQYIQHMINFELQSWKNLGDYYYLKGECKNAVDSYNKMVRINKNIFNELPQVKENSTACYR